ncbi:hypothetical protein LVJ85_07395 [Neisseria sp. Dent CA1/247]|uniref:DUF2515 family protein n=1 Tax=Neisseria sp. Dent CA1/247 TaxID=2912675 RepID=UPI001FD40F41|nr:hypothetical protein [Neisseria sp. Dent CA1/247]UOO75880.1 hypothetical protein LVJ85_07395 [Neisseria sp. Dent CA1/247]
MSECYKTNTTPQSQLKLCLECQNSWTEAQFEALNRMKSAERETYLVWFSPQGIVQRKGRFKIKSHYAQRAYDIAAVYAKMYLGAGEFQQFPLLKKHPGLFYWMGLAAFASKTVGCSLENPWVKDPGKQVKRHIDTLKYKSKVPLPTPVNMATLSVPTLVEVFSSMDKMLGKGNIWLFLDVMPWHYLYAKDREAFQRCRVQRKYGMLPEVMQEDLERVDGFEETVGNKSMDFSDSGKQYILKAFTALDRALVFLKQNRADSAAKEKLTHLLRLADHEQEIILQKIMYNSFIFKKYLEVSRYLESNHPDLYREMPQNELHLVASCKIKRGEERFLSAAPKGIVLENLKQRMKWIADAADLYHRRMSKPVDKQFLEEQLRILANGKKADGTEHA